MLHGAQPGIFSSVVKYLFRADFTAADVAEFANAQVLDTVAEGVTDGSATVAEGGGGTVEVATGPLLKVTGTGSSWANGWVGDDALTGAIGLVYKVTCKQDYVSGNGTGPIVGFTPTQSVDITATDIHAFYLRNVSGSLGIRIYLGSGGQSGFDITTFVDNTNEQLAVILGGYNSSGVPYQLGDTKASFNYGAAYFQVQSGSWTLLYRTNNSAPASVYPLMTHHAAAGSAIAYMDTCDVPDPVNNGDLSSILAPEYIDTSVSASDTFTHSADHVSEILLTSLPSSGNIDVYYRTDWAIRISSGGTVTLVEDADGTPTTRATSGTTATNTSVIKTVWSDESVTLFVDDGGKANYASAAANKTSTSGSVNTLGTGGAISHIAGWPLTATAYNTALDAV